MRPTLFSERFGVPGEELDAANLLDPYIDTDTPLFIDPLLIDKSSNSVLRTDGIDQFRQYFENVVRLLQMAEVENDAAWKAAERLLSLKEPAENGLGYSRSKRAGTSRPGDVRSELLRTVQHVIRLGSKDPEMLSLMGFLETGIGPDTISDFTTVAMSEALARITNDFCTKHSVPVFPNSLSAVSLPVIMRKGVERPVVLVPRDVLRDLPVTESWGDVWEAAEHNRVLRDKLSVMLAGIAQPTMAERKEALKKAVMRSSEVFDAFLEAVKKTATSYDPNEDIKGFFAFRDFIRNNGSFETGRKYHIRKNSEEVQRLIMDALGVSSITLKTVTYGSFYGPASSQRKKEQLNSYFSLLLTAIAEGTESIM